MRIAILLSLTGLLLTVASGCDSWPESNPGETDPPLQTQILDIMVQPDPVPAGSTATITVAIADSTDDSFTFSWFFEDYAIETEDNTVEWTAPNKSGEYRHGLTVRRKGSLNPAPSANFKVTVVEKVQE